MQLISKSLPDEAEPTPSGTTGGSKMDDRVNTGSAKPVAPVSKNDGGAVGGKGPGAYSPASAAKHLDHVGTESCAPKNNGPMGH